MEIKTKKKKSEAKLAWKKYLAASCAHAFAKSRRTISNKRVCCCCSSSGGSVQSSVIFVTLKYMSLCYSFIAGKCACAYVTFYSVFHFTLFPILSYTCTHALSVCLSAYFLLVFFRFFCHHSILTISINCTAVQECIKLNQVSTIERSILMRYMFVFACFVWLGGGDGGGYFSLYRILLPHTTFARAHTNLISGQLCLILFIGNPAHFTCFWISIDII